MGVLGLPASPAPPPGHRSQLVTPSSSRGSHGMGLRYRTRTAGGPDPADQHGLWLPAPLQPLPSPQSQAFAHCSVFCSGPLPRPVGVLGLRSPPRTWARGLSTVSARHIPASPHPGLSSGHSPAGVPCRHGTSSPVWGLTGGNLGAGCLAPPGLPLPSGQLLVHHLWGLPWTGVAVPQPISASCSPSSGLLVRAPPTLSLCGGVSGYTCPSPSQALPRSHHGLLDPTRLSLGQAPAPQASTARGWFGVLPVGFLGSALRQDGVVVAGTPPPLRAVTPTPVRAHPCPQRLPAGQGQQGGAVTLDSAGRESPGGARGSLLWVVSPRDLS